MTTLVVTIVLGAWALLFALLAVVPLLPDIPAATRIGDVADSAARPLAPITEHRAAA